MGAVRLPAPLAAAHQGGGRSGGGGGGHAAQVFGFYSLFVDFWFFWLLFVFLRLEHLLVVVFFNIRDSSPLFLLFSFLIFV